MGDDSRREDQTGPGPQKAQWAVKLDPGNDADQVAQQHGFINLGPVANLKDYFLFEAGSHHTKRDTIERSAQVRDTVSQRTADVWRVSVCVCVLKCVCTSLCCRTWRTTRLCRGWRNR
jgi:hypothetical protein